MKKIYTFLLLAFFTFNNSVFAQLDTSNRRYYNEIFPSVTTSLDVVFGAYTNFGFQTNLTMDIYQPTGDPAIARPLIIWAHGGSFQFGDKNETDIVALCQTFAKRGYVCASINYRTGFFPIDSVNATQAVLKATQDMKASVRFFRKDAATSNTYKIHPNYIYVGGSSAGAFMALHLAYMDKVSEFPLGAATLASLDGLEGATGNPGYPSNASAVINLCGALADANFLEPGDIPFVSMHGNADGTVPYAHSIIVSLGYSVMYVDGSAAIHARANAVGVNNPFYTFNGADHVPYLNDSAYLDTTVNFVRNFLHPLVAAAPLNVKKQSTTSEISIFPNPSNGNINLFFALQSNQYASFQLCDISGRIVREEIIIQPNTTIERRELCKGVYFLKIIDGNSLQYIKKVLFE